MPTQFLQCAWKPISVKRYLLVRTGGYGSSDMMPVSYQHGDIIKGRIIKESEIEWHVNVGLDTVLILDKLAFVQKK